VVRRYFRVVCLLDIDFVHDLARHMADHCGNKIRVSVRATIWPICITTSTSTHFVCYRQFMSVDTFAALRDETT